jgi:hypothetical protein
MGGISRRSWRGGALGVRLSGLRIWSWDWFLHVELWDWIYDGNGFFDYTLDFTLLMMTRSCPMLHLYDLRE